MSQTAWPLRLQHCQRFQHIQARSGSMHARERGKTCSVDVRCVPPMPQQPQRLQPCANVKRHNGGHLGNPRRQCASAAAPVALRIHAGKRCAHVRGTPCQASMGAGNKQRKLTWHVPLQSGADNRDSCTTNLDAHCQAHSDRGAPRIAAAARRPARGNAHHRSSPAQPKAPNAAANARQASATAPAAPAQPGVVLDADGSSAPAQPGSSDTSMQHVPQRRQACQKRKPANAAVAAGKRVSMLTAVFRVECTQTDTDPGEPWRWTKRLKTTYCSGIAVRLPYSDETWLLTTAAATYCTVQVCGNTGITHWYTVW